MKKRILSCILLCAAFLVASSCTGADGPGDGKGDTIPAPVMKEGRYEADADMLLPNYTYTLNSVKEVDGRQGIAYYKGYYYVSGSTNLSVYDKEWFRIAGNDIPFDMIASGVNHIGDIDVYDGKIYAGVEYFKSGDAKRIQIAVYYADTLNLDDAYPIVPKSEMTEVSGITVDLDNGYIWMCSWADDDSGKYLYAYDLDTKEYVKKVQLLSPPRWIQGIAYYDGWIYITSDDGDANLGEPDHVYRCKADPDATSFSCVLERTLDDVSVPGEVEGLSFDPEKHQMLINYNRGKNIVKGMAKEFYEGYDQEIHEIYIYDMEKN